MTPQTAWFACTVRLPADQARAVGEPVRVAVGGGVEQEAGRLDRVAGDDDVAGLLEAPAALAVVVHAGRPVRGVDLDLPDHREVADLGPAASARGSQVTRTLCLALVEQP